MGRRQTKLGSDKQTWERPRFADLAATAELSLAFEKVAANWGSRQSPFGKRVSRRGREKRDSEEVRLHNFVYLGGVVHDMRKLWRPYSQS